MATRLAFLLLCLHVSRLYSGWITCGIPFEWYCDNQRGCPIGEDGKGCSSSKRSCSGEFICDIAKCMTKRWQCDGDNDCGDNSDERGCQTCFADEFLCANISRCIPKTWRCDGDEDCHDSSDEQGCPPSTFHACSAREFKCANNRCIHRTWRCDGEVDCTDSSDEEYCRPCSPGQYACKNGECIPAPPTCDGKADCSDHSDEEKCPAKEKHCDLDTQFDCQKNGENCISLTDVCNQRDDCGQGEDEGQHVCHQTDLCVGNKIGCAHKCVFNYNGARCTCHNGFKLNPDNKTCDGSNPCGNNNGGCSYICLPAPCLEQKCPEITCACPDSADSGVLSKDSTRCTMPEVPVLPTTKNIPSKEEPQVITAGPQGTSNSPKDCNAGKITGIVIAIIVAISALL